MSTRHPIYPVQAMQLVELNNYWEKSFHVSYSAHSVNWCLMNGIMLVEGLGSRLSRSPTFESRSLTPGFVRMFWAFPCAKEGSAFWELTVLTSQLTGWRHKPINLHLSRSVVVKWGQPYSLYGLSGEFRKIMDFWRCFVSLLFHFLVLGIELKASSMLN